MPRLALTFFGVFQTELDGQLIHHFRSANVKGLFVFLALQAERPFSRDTLAALFWPDEPDSVAKKNLRQSLYQLRQLLSDSDKNEQPFLLVSRQTVQFNGQSDTAVDVYHFLRAIEQGNLEDVRDIYQGELLPGFTCDSLEFENWLRQERERLHRLAMTAFYDLANRQIHQGNFAAAQTTARRQLQLEPWREVAHQQLMHALALAGERDAALAQLQTCEDALYEELGVSPSDETFALYRQIKENKIAPIDPDLIANRYSLGEQIGQGAMGIVYKGQDSQTGQPVAIKMLNASIAALNPEFVERFRREGEALRRLNHPNIVKLLDVDQKGDQHYLVMGYISGGDLQRYLATQPRLPIEQALTIALNLADALTRAHSLHILHRDLKPANILLDEDLRPYLTDFGVARLGQDSQLTQTGVVIGTYSYLSPEACRGSVLDERADIWSFGVVLYEMLAGKRPFSGPTSPATLIAILQDPLPDIRLTRPDLPEPLDQLIAIILEKGKERRIGSIRQVGAIIEAILHNQDTSDLLAPFQPSTQTAPSTTIPTKVTLPDSGQTTLPAPLPHFAGRTAEMSHIIQTLQRTTCRLLTLTGPGGIGKSHLATEVAHKYHAQTGDVLIYVNTNGVQTQSKLLALLAQALLLEPTEQLVDDITAHLQSAKTVLLLDNVEQLATLDAQGLHDLLTILLEGAPQLRLLVTSRQPLHLPQEWLLPIRGLALPPTTELSAKQWSQYAAITLFERRAQQADVTFALTPRNIDDVVHLLHLLDGAPLAIELTARQTQQQSVTAIRHDVQMEPQQLPNLLNVFDQSWDLLADDERMVLAQTAVFHHGFSRAAAHTVLGVTVSQLENLVDKSLLMRQPADGPMRVRYRLPHLLHHYLRAKDGVTPQLQNQHANYYLDWATTHRDYLGSERENIAAAWQWAQQSDAVAVPRRWDAAWLETEPISVQPVREVDVWRETAVLIGRDTELTNLRQALMPISTQHKNGGLITITGGAGIGKTHLITQLKRENQSINWCSAPCDETSKQALHPFRHWLRTYFGQADEAAFTVRFDELLHATADKALRQELQENKSFLAALVDVHLPDSPYGRLQPEQRLEHFQQAIKTLVKAESLSQPLILHIEDAHWIDAESRTFLEFLTRRVGDHPFLILITARPEQFEPLLLLDLPQKTIRLEPLSETAVSQLATHHLNSEPSPALLDLLMDRAAGNPFYTEQILLYLHESGLVVDGELIQTTGYTTKDQRLPLDIHNLLAARLNFLEKETQDLVAQAAVLGHEFSLPVLRQMIPDDQLQQGLRDGIQAAIWQPIANEWYAFNHAFLRDAAYNTQFARRKQELHKQAADAVTAVATADQPHHATIARHLDAANNPRRAVNQYLKAGDEATANYFIREAHNHYTRGLQLAQTDKQRLQLLLGREAVNHWLGNREQQAEDLRQLVTLSQAQGDKAMQMDITLRRASFALATANYDQAIRYAQQTTALAAAAHNRALEATAYHRWGRALWQQGKPKSAEPILKRALKLAEASNNLSEQAQSYYDLSIIAYYHEAYDDARQQLNEALSLFTDLDDKRNVIRCINLLGLIHQLEGDFETALDYQLRAVESARSIDWPFGEVHMLGHLANCYFELGDFAQSRQIHNEGLALSQMIGNRETESVSLDTIGLCYQFEGDLHTAKEYFLQADAIAEETNNKGTKAYVKTHLGLAFTNLEEIEQAGILLYEALTFRDETNDAQGSIDTNAALAWLDLARGDVDFAVDRARDILHTLTINGFAGVELPLQVYWQCYTICNLAGETAVANEALAAGYNLLQSRAQKIKNEERRQMYLNNVPHHHQIMAAWQSRVA